MKELPYFEVLINDYDQGKISRGAFNQLLLQDEKLREWFQLHQILEKSFKNDNGKSRLHKSSLES